jgi:[acyl-carrier-protein] S-malonyltransferase
LEWLDAGTPVTTSQIEGEHLFAVERLVVSPASGIFTPIDDIRTGAAIDVGMVIGHIGDVEVRSPFAGVLQTFIAVDTERVTARQPIAWLRTP